MVPRFALVVLLAAVPSVVGVRMFSERIAVDLGLLHVLGADMGNWPFVPWVDFAVQL